MFDFPSNNLKRRLALERFQTLALSPSAWRMQAQTLQHAAKRIRDIVEASQIRITNDSIDALRATERPKCQARTLSEEETMEFQDSQMMPVYFMLIGLSFENLLKGIAIKNYPEFLENGKKLNKNFPQHNLVSLARRSMADVALTDSEKKILDFLSTFVSYRGRYLIKKEFDYPESDVPIEHSQIELLRLIDVLWLKIWDTVPSDTVRPKTE